MSAAWRFNQYSRGLCGKSNSQNPIVTGLEPGTSGSLNWGLDPPTWPHIRVSSNWFVERSFVLFLSLSVPTRSVLLNILHLFLSLVRHECKRVKTQTQPSENIHYMNRPARKPTSLTLRKVSTRISLSMPRRLTRIDTFRLQWIFCFRNHYSIHISP